MPFQKGNKEALKGNKDKLWSKTLARAIKQGDTDRVREAAEQLLNQAAGGEQWAIKELADRLDGKVAQTQEITGADGGNVIIEIIKQSVADADSQTAE